MVGGRGHRANLRPPGGEYDRISLADIHPLLAQTQFHKSSADAGEDPARIARPARKETPLIRGFFHVSFTVSNLEASVKWYTEVLGLEYVRGQVQHNAYTARLVNFPDAHLKVAQLRVPGETIPLSRHHIELVEYVHPRGEDIPLDTNRTGVGHWAFMVEDLHAEFARLKALGVQFKSDGPVAIEAGVNKGGYTIYLNDPDGITLELVQPPQ